MFLFCLFSFIICYLCDLLPDTYFTTKRNWQLVYERGTLCKSCLFCVVAGVSADWADAKGSWRVAWKVWVGSVWPAGATTILPLWWHGEPLSHICDTNFTGKMSECLNYLYYMIPALQTKCFTFVVPFSLVIYCFMVVTPTSMHFVLNSGLNVVIASFFNICIFTGMMIMVSFLIVPLLLSSIQLNWSDMSYRLIVISNIHVVEEPRLFIIWLMIFKEGTYSFGSEANSFVLVHFHPTLFLMCPCFHLYWHDSMGVHPARLNRTSLIICSCSVIRHLFSFSNKSI